MSIQISIVWNPTTCRGSASASIFSTSLPLFFNTQRKVFFCVMASLTSTSNLSNPSSVPSRTATGQTISLTPSLVGQQFVKTYYDVLSKKPEHLFRFYKEDSQFTVATGILEKATLQSAQGQEEIGKLVKNIPFGSCSYKLSSVDAQGSSNGSIVVQVTGYIALEGFYVRNDILHMLQEMTTTHSQPVKENLPDLNTSGVDVTNKVTPVGKQRESNVDSVSTSTLAASQSEAPQPRNSPTQAHQKSRSPTETQNLKSESLHRTTTGETLQGMEDEKLLSGQQKKSWASIVGSKPTPSQNVVPNNVGNQMKQRVAPPQDNINREKVAGEERKGERPRERSGASVYISNFPKHLTEEMLLEEFSRFGKVLNVDLHLERGFAFVDMESVEDVEAAVEAWNSRPPTAGPLAGMDLTVQQRKPLARGSRGGRDTRGRGYGGGSRGGRNFGNRAGGRRSNSGTSGEATRSGGRGGGRFAANRTSYSREEKKSRSDNLHSTLREIYAVSYVPIRLGLQ
ncbi:Putative G3BP-like protein [Galdieria sulphuraria]|nr:Putative G3BP-like protein [Galdieria sulphuraria]